MTKINKKDIDSFMKYEGNKNTTLVTYEYGENTLEIEVQTSLTIDEKTAFINRVVNGCFDSDNEYRPEFRDVIFQTTILQMLTNVPIYEKKIPELDDNGNETEKKIAVVDMDNTYALCKKLNLYEKVADPDFRQLINELVYLIETKLAFEQQRIIAGERKALARAMTEMETGVALVSSIGEKLSESMTATVQENKLIEMTSEFKDRMDRMSDSELLDSILKASK